jgi:alpha-beta hydrolase superfamily lysophospholipase
MTQAADLQPAEPTIVLVHSAFAKSSSWNAVIAELSRDGYRTIAAANPLRGVTRDAAAAASIVRPIPGPVVLSGIPMAGR